MSSSARNELDSIKTELNKIISELERISGGVRKDFIGVGNDKCSDCINSVIRQYYVVKNKLNSVDVSILEKLAEALK